MKKREKNSRFDKIKTYDTIEVKYQNLYNCAQISPVKTFGLYVNIEVPLEIYVEGINDSLLEVRTSNGTISKYQHFYKIKTEKIGVTIISIFHNRKEITKRYFSALKLPRPAPKLGNFNGKIIKKSSLLKIPGLWAEMPYFCDLYGASIESFSIVVFQNGIENKLNSNNSRFTEEQINLINDLESGQVIYFEDIIGKIQDGFKHDLEIFKIIIK